MHNLVQNFVADESGSSAIEYCVVASIASLATLAMMRTVGLTVVGRLDQVLQALIQVSR